jgi:hypothetical protein
VRRRPDRQRHRLSHRRGAPALDGVVRRHSTAGAGAGDRPGPGMSGRARSGTGREMKRHAPPGVDRTGPVDGSTPPHLGLTDKRDTTYGVGVGSLVGASVARGNPVRLRDCPAAVSRHDRRNMPLGRPGKARRPAPRRSLVEHRPPGSPKTCRPPAPSRRRVCQGPVPPRGGGRSAWSRERPGSPPVSASAMPARVRPRERWRP